MPKPIWSFVVQAWKYSLAKNLSFFRSSTPKILDNIVPISKRHILARNDTFWAVFVADRMRRVGLRAFPVGEHLGKFWGS